MVYVQSNSKSKGKSSKKNGLFTVRYLLLTLPMRLWRLMILMEMMLEVVIGVLVMEVGKVADEVTDMEVDKVADMKIPIEDLTEVILEILVFE